MGIRKNREETFDSYEDFVPENIPSPGKFLEGHRVLVDQEHIEFHQITRDIFDERRVYDMTFNYNLARLNLDKRHPDAGYRYAIEDDSETIRAEFTPTTKFCPQSHTLVLGSFRAWNGLSDRHGYQLIKVRVNEMHHNSEETNRVMKRIEQKYQKKGTNEIDSSRQK